MLEPTDTIEFEGDVFDVYEDNFDWNKAIKYYRKGRLGRELRIRNASDTVVDGQQILDFYFNNTGIVRAIVDHVVGSLTTKTFAGHVKETIERIERERDARGS